MCGEDGELLPCCTKHHIHTRCLFEYAKCRGSEALPCPVCRNPFLEIVRSSRVDTDIVASTRASLPGRRLVLERVLHTTGVRSKRRDQARFM